MGEDKVINYFSDISGRDKFEKPKAHVSLIFSLQFSDGSAMGRQELEIPQKPVVDVFKHAGFVNVLLDFRNREDNDLAMAWHLLTEYSNPENSVDWTEDELESGYYTDNEGKKCMIYFPMVELVLSPIGKETEYIMRGLNPAFYTLQPNNPKGAPCVLQLTFPEDWFFVDDELEPVDLDEISKELEEELGVDPAEAGEPGHRR